MSRLERVLRLLRKQPPAAPPTRERGWMGTATGNKFYPLDPRPTEVHLPDIARGLAMTCRYGGQVKRFYSVAEHCVRVSAHVPWQYAKEALLHDSAEAFIGDMIRPLKHQPEMVAFREAEAKIETAIFERFEINSTPESRAAIKEIDDRILVDEITQLSAEPGHYLSTPLLRDKAPLGIHLACLPPLEAERSFLFRFQQLFGYVA